MEDSLFAGALVKTILKSGKFITENDSANAALNLWKEAKDNLLLKAKEFSHYKRLVKLGAEKDAIFALEMDSLDTIPYLKKNTLISVCP
jgi:2-phosphosulfolactate phosphatase